MITGEIITKKDLQIELGPIRSDIQIMKWMAGLTLGIAVTILFKVFN